MCEWRLRQSLASLGLGRMAWRGVGIHLITHNYQLVKSVQLMISPFSATPFHNNKPGHNCGWKLKGYL